MNILSRKFHDPCFILAFLSCMNYREMRESFAERYHNHCLTFVANSSHIFSLIYLNRDPISEEREGRCC